MAAPAVWERPPPEEWDPPTELSFSLSASSRLFIKTSNYRGKCVDFVICHQIGGPYRWADLFRIDSKHGTIHSHDFTRRTETRVTIAVIADPDTVDNQYAKQFDFMLATWAEREKGSRHG